MTDKAPGGNKIEFISFHEPALKDGDYEITVTQKLTLPPPAGDVKDKPPPEPPRPQFTATQAFAIKGPRTNLEPAAILSVFPPPGSAGDHATTLPHVILSRSTLPWERASADGDGPWLALLLFAQEEAPELQSITRAELKAIDVYEELETGEMADERLSVIDVPVALLEAIIPTRRELELLAHVRQWKDESGQSVAGERAVVVANRLPGRGGMSVAHLVSVEERYQGDKFDTSRNVADGKIRLVSLKSWQFSCPEHASYRITSASIDRLQAANAPKPIVDACARLLAPRAGANPLTAGIVGDDHFLASFTAAFPKITLADDQKKALLAAARYQARSFRALLLDIGRSPATLRLPDDFLKPAADTPSDALEKARTFIKRSYIPLPHHLRNGGQTVSWYHGPFISAHKAVTDVRLPIRSADQLLRYWGEEGMLDTAYASAWELGRLMALESKQFSTTLFQWKRAHAHHKTIKDTAGQLAHLPFNQLALPPHTPQIIGSWLYDLALLRGVPFQYLVPDERMLPHESLRFFQVDGRWVECLLDGAFSIGRVTPQTHSQDQAHYDAGRAPAHLAAHPANGQSPPVHELSGVLLRSAVVAGWPELQVDGFATITSRVKATQKQLNQGQLSKGLRNALAGRKLTMGDEVSVDLLTSDTGDDGQTVGTGWRLSDDSGRSLEIYLEEGRLLVPLPLLRCDLLGGDVLLCLFAGSVAVLDLHQKGEALHFGFSHDGEKGYFKELRALASGRETEALTVTVPFRGPANGLERVVALADADGLADRLEKKLSNGQLNAASFALEMIEGVTRVRYEAGPSSANA